MKKYIIIIFTLLVVSCDSLGVGVEEFQSESSYHDYVALGWKNFFETNYNVAIEYFNAAIELEDEYYNSAYMGIGWCNLMKANLYIGSNPELVDEYRAIAYEKFSYSIDEELAISSYAENCVYPFCCDSCFIDDRNAGIILHNVLEYLESNESNVLEEELILSIREFIDSHKNDNFYNIMNGKPENLGVYNFTTNNIVVLMSQLYLRNNQLSCAMNILFENNICESFNLYNSECCDTDCSEDIDPIPIIECLESYTSF
tara:strand:- start:263 stop:1036 length:774 start_codon:yes stop_codon:yes gene_type:complete